MSPRAAFCIFCELNQRICRRRTVQKREVKGNAMPISGEAEWQAFLVHLLTKIIEQFKEAERFFQLAEMSNEQPTGSTLSGLRLLENCFRICERIHGMLKAADSVHYSHLEKEGAIGEFQGMSRKTGKLQREAQDLYVKVWRKVKKAEDAMIERFYWK